MTFKIQAAVRLQAAKADHDKAILQDLGGMLAMKLSMKDLPSLSYRMASPGKMILRGPGTEAVQTQKRMDLYPHHYPFKLADIKAFLDKNQVRTFKR